MKKMSRNRVFLLCAAIMLALAVSSHGQTPAQAQAVSAACHQWFLPLDEFSMISDDNYDRAIRAWRQVSQLMPQRIDSLAVATGLTFHNAYKLVESLYMSHPFMAKKAAYERLKGKEWKEKHDMDFAIIDNYMKGATLTAREAMLAEISFAANDKNDVNTILYDYYAPINDAYNELLGKGLDKYLLDSSRLRCLHELDSVARVAPLSSDVEERINTIVWLRLQDFAAKVAAITSIEDLEKCNKVLQQLEHEIVEAESTEHSAVWSKKLKDALWKQGHDLLQARHAALWDDLMGRMRVVARPAVQNYAKDVSKTRDNDELCKIFNYYSKKIDKGGELYNLLLKNGFSKGDIDRYRHEYIKELEQH